MTVTSKEMAMMKTLWLCLLALAMFAFADAGAAVPAGADQFKNETYNALTAEILLPYLEKTYAKPIELRLFNDPSRLDLATPEAALRTFFSSLVAGDVAWNDRLWTDASRRFNKAKDAEEKRPAGYWPQRWMETYGGKRIELLKRIEYAKYVIIEYSVSHPSVSQPIEQGTLAFVKQGDRWLVTQELLGRNPIMFVTKAPPNGRVQLGLSVFEGTGPDTRP